MSNFRRILIVLFLIALAVGVFFVLKTYDNQDELMVYGTLQKINGNTLDVYGFRGVKSSNSDREIISIKTDDDTIIEKTTYELPPGVSVADAAKLPRETRQVDIFVLQRDFRSSVIETEIELKTNFLLLTDITAKKVKYSVPKR